MNILPADKQVRVVAALVEGASIRTTERLTGTHRDTIMRLGGRVGRGCAALHDAGMRGLNSPLIEMDELWSFVGKKQRRVKPEDGAGKGDQYVFLALDAHAKAILSWRVGKRDGDSTLAFIADLRSRVLNAPQINSDGFPAYEPAIREVFGEEVHYGQIVKRFVGEPPKDAARRYSPGVVVGVSKARVIGFPVGFQISTSYAERANLTVRMGCRRFTRLTNGFSKTLANHEAAVALFVAHYNLCRVHETLRTTPAVALGVADRVWTIGDLVGTALAVSVSPSPAPPPAPVPPDAPPPPPSPVPQRRRRGPFTVIDGGLP